MIPAASVRAFLDRPRADYRPWKALPDRVLQRKADSLAVKPPIWRKLTKHQRTCFIIGAFARRFAFLLSTGMGKTLLAIALSRYFEKAGEVRRVLVLVRNKSNKAEWADEVLKHSHADIMILEGSSAEKWAQLERSSSLFVVETYAGFVRMVCDLDDTGRAGRAGQKQGKRRKLRPSAKKLKRVQLSIQGLILDESTEAKNKGALPYRLCKQLSKHVHFIYALTGTPFGRDPIDLWAQFDLIDHGKTLGETLGLFRAALFKEVQTPWAIKYKFDGKNEKTLNRMIAACSIRYEPEEGDLPECSSIIKKAILPEEAEAYYRRMRDRIIESGGNYSEMKNAFMRMRQISSGFFGVKDDETGERIQIAFESCPKLELLISLLQEITPAHKAIVFHDFVYSGSRICTELEDAGIEFVLLNGKTKDAQFVLDRFKRKDKCRTLILNNSAGGFGLNLQIARYGIYYESPVPVIIRKQTEARFIRQHSQHRRVFKYDLVTKGTMDEKILEFHAQGKDLFRAIVEGKVKP